MIKEPLNNENESSDIWKIKDDESITGYLKIIEGKKYFITKNKIKNRNDKYLEINRQNKGNERMQLNYKPIKRNNVNFYQVLNDIQNEYFDENHQHYPEEYKIAIEIFKEKKPTNKKHFIFTFFLIIVIIFLAGKLLYDLLFKKNNRSNSNTNPPLQENLNESIPIHKVYTENEDNPHDNIYYVKMEDNTESYNKNGTIKYNNGNIKYIGPFRNNVAHGNGKYYDRDKNLTIKFEGNFTDGYFESGTLYLDSGNYTGNFKKSKFDGKGIFQYNNGNKYNGTWKNDSKENGRMDYGKGEYYDGHWANNKYEGIGKHKFSNGDYYEGEYKNDLRDGKGIYYWADGGYYNGSWKKGLRQGKGKQYFGKERNTNYYEGDFENDKRHGEGKYVYQNGEYYNGEWKNNEKDGKGIFNYQNGEYYDGHWKNNKREGEGTLYYTDGYYYEGHWKNDKREGKGKIKKNGKKIYSGDFKNDCYDYGFFEGWFDDYPHDC